MLNIGGVGFLHLLGSRCAYPCIKMRRVRPRPHALRQDDGVLGRTPRYAHNTDGPPSTRPLAFRCDECGRGHMTYNNMMACLAEHQGSNSSRTACVRQERVTHAGGAADCPSTRRKAVVGRISRRFCVSPPDPKV